MTRPRFTPPLPSGTAPRTPRALGRPGILLLAVGAAAMPACDVQPDPPGEEHRVVGFVDLTGDLEPQIPETATASVPVPITLWTTGGGCHRGGDTEVSVEGRTAVVTPYDFVLAGPGVVCTLPLLLFAHRTTVVFNEPGTAYVVVRYSTGEHFPPHGHDGAGRKSYLVEVAPAG